MHQQSALVILAALSNETRLDIFRLLVRTGPEGVSARRIGERLGMTQSGLSFHLRELAHACLVNPRQTGSGIAYALNVDTTRGLLAYLSDEMFQGVSCELGRPTGQTHQADGGEMEDRIYNVLFLCTGNSARSIMAEALLNTMGRGRFRAFSAGSRPAGDVHPLALEQLAGIDYPCGRLRSKSWDEFGQPDSPHMDFIFTVCDSAAGETCPVWPGHPVSAHWAFEDPASVSGEEEAKRAGFHRVYRQILTRMNLFVSLPLHMLEKNAIQVQLDGIGNMPG